MKNIFYFHQSVENSKNQILLNDVGCSPVNIGYGYRLTSNGNGYAKVHAIVGVTSELTAVERIFRDFIAHKSIPKIVHSLNEERIPTRSNKGWNYNSVSNILKNENYIGIFLFRKYELCSVGESLKYVPKRKANLEKVLLSGLDIISTDIWNQAQTIRLKRNRSLQKKYRLRKQASRHKQKRKSAPTSPSPINYRQSVFAVAWRSFMSLVCLELPNKVLQILRSSAN